MKILLDTDIGSDIDDALALLYLLAQKNCELLGITTVTGESIKRAALAKLLISHMRKDVAVIPGAETPLVIPQKQKLAPQASSILKDERQTKKANPNEAISFLYNTIKENPGEITLLCIGPLTNIANLIQQHPNVLEKLKEIVIMSGVYTNTLKSVEAWSTVEWNASLDPHALSLVLSSQIPKIRLVGLDVTVQLVIEKNDFLNHFNHSVFKPLHQLAAIWFKERDRITFHDPLAASIIFNTQICTYSQVYVEVELQSQNLAGFTTKKQNLNSNIYFAETVDKKQFFDDFFSVLENYSIHD
jgi:purine nucleosidase